MEFRLSCTRQHSKNRLLAASSQEVLLVDADTEAAARTRQFLIAAGHAVVTARTGSIGVERALGHPWWAIILDARLPDMDGLEVLRRIRRTSNAPVLVHMAQADEYTVIAALELGADGCLDKGGCPQHLLARLHAITRRWKGEDLSASELPVAAGGLWIEPETRRVTLHDQAVALTAGEFDILLCLARAKGQVRTRDHLLAEVRQRAYRSDDRSIDVQMSSLRRKLGDSPKCPRFIRTVRSAGYVLVRPEDEG